MIGLAVTKKVKPSRPIAISNTPPLPAFFINHPMMPEGIVNAKRVAMPNQTQSQNPSHQLFQREVREEGEVKGCSVRGLQRKLSFLREALRIAWLIIQAVRSFGRFALCASTELPVGFRQGFWRKVPFITRLINLHAELVI